MLYLGASVDTLVNMDANNFMTSWTDLSGNGYDALPSRGTAIYPSSKTFDNGLDGIDLYRFTGVEINSTGRIHIYIRDIKFSQ